MRKAKITVEQSSLNPMSTAYETYGSIFKPKLTHACKPMMLFQDGQSGQGDGAFCGGGGCLAGAHVGDR